MLLADDTGNTRGRYCCRGSAEERRHLSCDLSVQVALLLQVQLLNTEHNPDVMLLAARAITFLADVLPSSCSSIVRHGAVPAFCARLLTIEYIDLAEQSLQVTLQSAHPGSPPASCQAISAPLLSNAFPF